MPTVADLIVEGLVRAEVPRLFGVPGGGSNLEVLEAARSRGLPFVLCHQEWAHASPTPADTNVSNTPMPSAPTSAPGTLPQPPMATAI